MTGGIKFSGCRNEIYAAAAVACARTTSSLAAPLISGPFDNATVESEAGVASDGFALVRFDASSVAECESSDGSGALRFVPSDCGGALVLGR